MNDTLSEFHPFDFDPTVPVETLVEGLVIGGPQVRERLTAKNFGIGEASDCRNLKGGFLTISTPHFYFWENAIQAKVEEMTASTGKRLRLGTAQEVLTYIKKGKPCPDCWVVLSNTSRYSVFWTQESLCLSGREGQYNEDYKVFVVEES